MQNERLTKIITGDALHVLASMPAKSVHCIVTSPPYYGLRDYGSPGQIGGEPSHLEYLAALTAVFREAHRVLRDDGTLWLNLGDSYATVSGAGAQGKNGQRAGRRHTASIAANKKTPGVKPKNLLGLPWWLALTLQADGWYLRQDIIWSKPNPTPESVKDRCTKSHEYLFLLTKSDKYFFDNDAIQEPALATSINRAAHVSQTNARKDKPQSAIPGVAVGCEGGMRNKRSVWVVPVARFRDAHFATFPPSLIDPCIRAGTSEGGACASCGKPLRRVLSSDPSTSRMTLGWRKACGCKTKSRTACVVLDPFGGAGTTALVADRLNRGFVLIELNPDYAAMSEQRIEQDRHMRSLDPDQSDNQLEMFVKEPSRDAKCLPAFPPTSPTYTA